MWPMVLLFKIWPTTTFYIHISFPFLDTFLFLQSVIRSSWLPHFCNSILPLSETDVLSISTWQLVVYRSKLNCEKLALYTLHTIGCKFKVWHFTNVKSTDTAIDLANFQERRQCGFLSMIIINEFYNDVVTHRRKPTVTWVSDDGGDTEDTQLQKLEYLHESLICY